MPPFEKTTSSDDKTNVYFIEKLARRILETFEQNHGLTPLEICKFFDYSKMTFLSSKKPPFEKTTSSDDKTNVYFTESWLERYLEYLTRIMV